MDCKKLLLILWLLAFNHAFATHPQQDSVSVRINFDYQGSHLQNVTSIDGGDHNWKIIGRSVSRTNGNTLLLLTKLMRLKEDQVRMEFLVIDLTQHKDLAFETKMKLRLGKEQAITLKKQGKVMKLSMKINKNK